jgi:DUF1680 family protein
MVGAVCPSHYMGIVELYRTTRESRYLELAKTFLDMRDLVRDGDDDNQDRLTAHSETCANIGSVLWNWRMFLEPIPKICGMGCRSGRKRSSTSASLCRQRERLVFGIGS